MATIYGKLGKSALISGTGEGFLDGGADDDIFIGGVGGTGDDFLDGGADDDILIGGVGGTGDDFLDGGANDDILIGGGGDDTLDGGAGTDEVGFTGNAAESDIDVVAGGIRVPHMAPASGTGDGSDLLTGFERLRFADRTLDLTAQSAPSLTDAKIVLPQDGGAVNGSFTATDADGDPGSLGYALQTGTVNGTMTVNPDGSFTATDADGDPGSLSYALQTGTVNGTVTVNPDGSYTFTPNAGFSGSDSFVAKVTDADGLAGYATIEIEVPAAARFDTTFQVNTTALEDSGFVAAWGSTQDGSGFDIYAKRYDADDRAVGSETKVNTYATSSQNSPSGAGLADGCYVLAWTSYGQDGDS